MPSLPFTWAAPFPLVVAARIVKTWFREVLRNLIFLRIRQLKISCCLSCRSPGSSGRRVSWYSCCQLRWSARRYSGHDFYVHQICSFQWWGSRTTHRSSSSRSRKHQSSPNPLSSWTVRVLFIDWIETSKGNILSLALYCHYWLYPSRHLNSFSFWERWSRLSCLSLAERYIRALLPKRRQGRICSPEMYWRLDRLPERHLPVHESFKASLCSIQRRIPPLFVVFYTIPACRASWGRRLVFPKN